MKQSLFILLISLFTTTLFAQNKEEAKLLEKVEALTNALFVTKDSTVIANLVNSKVSYGHSSGAIEDKTTMVHNAVANKTLYNDFAIEDMNISFAGNTAIVRHTLRSSAVDNGAGAPLNIGILQVWCKEKSGWQLLARQAYKVAPKK